MNYNLFLDDKRQPNKPFYNLKWITAKSYDEFVKIIQEKGMPSLISFDHDIGEEENGLDCAKWLCNYCLDNNIKLPEYIIHSSNYDGSRNIKYYIENFKKHNEI